MMALTPKSPQVRHARNWLKAMKLEVEARQQYTQADEPRSRERARKRWLKVRGDWARMKIPSDEALRIARQK
jgi:hypothetical protein